MDQQQNNNSWFHRAISLDEMKISSIVVAFLIFSGFAVYSLITKGDIPSNLLSLLELMIGVIGGVNAVSFVGNNLMMNKTNQPMPIQNNMYPNSMYNYNTYPSNNGMNSNMNGQSNTLPNTPPPQQMPIVNTGTQGKI